MDSTADLNFQAGLPALETDESEIPLWDLVLDQLLFAQLHVSLLPQATEAGRTLLLVADVVADFGLAEVGSLLATRQRTGR